MTFSNGIISAVNVMTTVFLKQINKLEFCAIVIGHCVMMTDLTWV